MNNHRSSNRRRGRGNRPQGGGNQSNRIDSRARGNAPQMLDKYKKLAQDAQHNGDRVQAEYYLQFADHYFRVLADGKTRQDEQRGKRQDDRDQDDDGDDDGDNRRRQSRAPRGRRDDANGRSDANDRDDDERDGGGRDNDESDYEPAENPFKRQPRSEERQPRSEERAPRGEARKPRKARNAAPAKDDAAIDAAALPPSIGGEVDGEAPKKKRAPRTRKTAEPADDGEAVRAVG